MEISDARRIAFGPVPSRRLGHSLGINNIPAKTCSYSCVYCQVGRTTHLQADRTVFYPPEEIFARVRQRLAQVEAQGEHADYLTFVPDGEPTLDVHLRRTIELLRRLNKKIAVISNSSLLWREDVRASLAEADWVSLKVDAADEETWRLVNRPHGDLDFTLLRDGMIRFAASYRGILTTESMLIGGANDGEHHLRNLAELIRVLQPSIAYVSVPHRPPAEPWVRAPGTSAVASARRLFSAACSTVGVLNSSEGDAFVCTGDAANDLLSIAAVHPMREEDVRAFLERSQHPWSLVQQLVRQGKLRVLKYEGQVFYAGTNTSHRKRRSTRRPA